MLFFGISLNRDIASGIQNATRDNGPCAMRAIGCVFAANSAGQDRNTDRTGTRNNPAAYCGSNRNDTRLKKRVIGRDGINVTIVGRQTGVCDESFAIVGHSIMNRCTRTRNRDATQQPKGSRNRCRNRGTKHRGVVIGDDCNIATRSGNACNPGHDHLVGAQNTVLKFGNDTIADRILGNRNPDRNRNAHSRAANTDGNRRADSNRFDISCVFCGNAQAAHSKHRVQPANRTAGARNLGACVHIDVIVNARTSA